MSIGECKSCAYWQGGDGAAWCDHGKCYTGPDHYTHCYCSREERSETTRKRVEQQDEAASIAEKNCLIL